MSSSPFEDKTFVDLMEAILQQSQNKKGSFDFIKSGLVPPPTISGKGSLVHQQAIRAGGKMLFSNYLTGWVGFNNLA